MSKISGTIITLNNEEVIEDCITSLKLVCDEVIVLDSLSTDNTTEIAKKMGARVFLQDFLGDGPQKKMASEYAKNDLRNCDKERVEFHNIVKSNSRMEELINE